MLCCLCNDSNIAPDDGKLGSVHVNEVQTTMTIKTSDVMRDIAQSKLDGKSIVLPSGAMLSVKACQHGRVTLSIDDTMIENAPLRDARLVIDKHCSIAGLRYDPALHTSATMEKIRQYVNLEIQDMSVSFDCISRDGTEHIVKYLEKCNLDKAHFASLDWRTEGLVQRIRKIVKRDLSSMGYSDSVEGIMCEVGNLIAKHTMLKGTMYFDIVDKFDWHAGDFGDSGSCYWGCRTDARAMLENDNALAIRFYRKLDNGDYDGIGRAWIVEHEGLAVVYNAYEQNSDGDYCQWNTLERYASVLAYLASCETKRITLTNNGESYGMLWINGAKGIVLGSHKHAGIDLDIAECDDNENTAQCEHCGRTIELEYDDYYTMPYGIICDSCHSDRYSYCETCEQDDIDNDDMVEVRVARRVNWEGRLYYVTEYMCSECASENTFTCEHCGERYLSEVFSSVETEENDVFCEDCAVDYTWTCEHCDTCHSTEGWQVSERVVLSDMSYCEDCAEGFVACSECSSLVERDNAHLAHKSIDWDGQSVFILDIEGTDMLCSECAKHAQ